MSRTIMAFDFGTKSIGSAIGQEITGTASPLKAFKANDGIPNWDDIEKQIKEWQPDLLVVGLPTDLHGKDLETITPRAKKFAKRLQGRYGLPVELHDERLSTSEARRIVQYGWLQSLIERQYRLPICRGHSGKLV